jgi:hypothetical protein
VRIDQPEAEDTPDGPHRTADAAVSGDRRGELLPADAGSSDPSDSSDSSVRTERTLVHRTLVDASYRQYAIDQGCARVEKLERETITPAMRRIEADDPERHLVGLEHRLKERYRIEEKVIEAVEERGRSVEEAFGMVKDAIRYTFEYPDNGYTAGVHADCDRLENAGFERFDRRNSWDQDEYKGINSRWRVPGSGQLFEIQFHTETGRSAKEETHEAYKQLRTLPADDAEVARLHAYQRDVTSKVPIPPGALDIPDY